MYYLKTEYYSNCTYIRQDIDGKSVIYARVYVHDFNTYEESVEFAEKLVELLNTK
jgi:hypothetical protein